MSISFCTVDKPPLDIVKAAMSADFDGEIGADAGVVADAFLIVLSLIL